MLEPSTLSRQFSEPRADVYFIDDAFGKFVCDTSQRLFKILINFGLKKKTVLLLSRTTRFVTDCDYFYMLKEGKVVDEGEKNKIGEKFKEVQQSDKVRQAQNLGLGASKANLFSASKVKAREPESEFVFKSDFKNSEINQILKDWKKL